MAAVVVYHAGVGILPGGFVGVEMFFVISGYLITSLLIAEHSATGRIDLGRFWIRRARRLLPALYTVLAATLVFMLVFMPAEAARLRGDALSALSYVTNWYLIFSEQSYFEAVSRPSALKHLWSLAIEEQFYLIWPPLLSAALALCARATARADKLLPALIAVAALASALLAGVLYDPGADPSRIYYGTDTRAGSLLAGAALAFVCRPRSERATHSPRPSPQTSDQNPGGRVYKASYKRYAPPAAAKLLEAGAAISLAALTAACVFLTEDSGVLYRGGFLAVSAATALLIAALVHPFAHQTLSSRLLSAGPVRWMGLRSYGIYLWHWPVFVLSRPGADIPLQGAPALALRVGATLVLAALCYRFIETPVRRGAIGRLWRELRLSEGRRQRYLRLCWAGALCGTAVSAGAIALAMTAAERPAQPEYLARESVASDAAATDGSRNGAAEGAADNPDEPSNPGTATAQPEKNPQGNPQGSPPGRVTVIGDSVMVGAAEEVESSLLKGSAAGNAAGGAQSVSIRARQGMQAAQAGDMVEDLAENGRLGDTLVVAVGNNGYFTEGQLRAILEASEGRSAEVVLVNNRVPRQWQEPNNDAIEAAAAGSDRAVLADWHHRSSAGDGLLYGDGIHLRPEGASAYADLISSKL